jgi:hypothetical protein
MDSCLVLSIICHAEQKPVKSSLHGMCISEYYLCQSLTKKSIEPYFSSLSHATVPLKVLNYLFKSPPD